MRIVHEIDHPRMKITCFQYEGKYSIKFEKRQMEILVKFRDLPSEVTIQNIANTISSSQLIQIEQKLDNMLFMHNDWIKAQFNKEEEDFPVII